MSRKNIYEAFIYSSNTVIQTENCAYKEVVYNSPRRRPAKK